ncbi:GIY-YIG nuclease family protein [Acinetobacter courvalinii]|uniref:GIY-YIG nuclease family protein n=1 Tax=Acinetobacter courvalinii TaxID=280147 RepID=UPI003A84CF9B
MKIELSWFEPIDLGSSNTLRENTRNGNFDYNLIPEISGVYIFYREFNQTQEPLYIGKSLNIRTRMKQHFKNIDLLEGLQNSKKGQKKLIFAEVKVRGTADLQRAIAQAEKGLIQHFVEDYELLNQKLMKDHFDEIYSSGSLIELVNIELDVYSSKSNKAN